MLRHQVVRFELQRPELDVEVRDLAAALGSGGKVAVVVAADVAQGDEAQHEGGEGQTTATQLRNERSSEW